MCFTSEVKMTPEFSYCLTFPNKSSDRSSHYAYGQYAVSLLVLYLEHCPQSAKQPTDREIGKLVWDCA